MKTKHLILIGLCNLCSFALYSQQLTITGMVKDERNKQNIEFATVSISNLDSTVLTGCYVKDNGTFTIENMKEGNYILCASYLGYKPYYKTIKLAKSENMDDIFLNEDETMLKEVVVTGKRPYIQQKVDRYVVNISDHLLTAGKNGLDILKSTPGLLVQNRSVTILGDQVDVWIDGRPSRMDQSTLATYLEGLQAENIDQIEIITNPSSGFDAGGGRGIINIKMKKNQSLDVINGSANIGYEQSKKQKGTGGIGLNYRTKKLNIYGSYNIRGGNDISDLHEVTNNTNQGQTTTYDKNVHFDTYKTISNNYRIGTDFLPDKSNIFGVLFNGFDNNDDTNSNSTTNISPPDNGTSLSLTDGKYNTNVCGQTYNLNYKHSFSKEGVELNMDADYGHILNKQDQAQNYTFFTSEGSQSQTPSSERNALPQTTDLWSTKIDYKHPVSQSLYWDMGAKVGGTKTDNNITYEELIDNNWRNDNDKSNHYNYQENIYAAYVNVRQQFNKFTYQAGIRTEYTYLKGSQVTTGEVHKKKYWDVFPTLFVQYIPGENHNLGVSYSRRIRRPNYQTLNPFEVTLDNYSYIAGNPNLDPSYTNNIELKYTFHQKLTTTLSWGRNNNMILLQPVTDEANDRYGYQYNNFGDRTAYIFMVSYNDKFFKIWRLNFMSQLAYIENKANEPTANFNNNGLSAALWMNNSFQINKTLSAEIGLLLQPWIKVGYTRNDMLNNNLSLGIRKNIVNDKVTISLTANDILNGQITKDITKLDNIQIYTEQNANQRNITLSVSYRFGSNKVKSSRSRSIGIEDELERSQ